MSKFYEKYVALCAKKNKTPSGAAVDIGLSKGTANGWKTGRQPNDLTLAKIALYFGVPVSYFSEDSENQNGPMVVSVDELKELPKDERLLISYYRQMTAEERELIENMAKTIIKSK